MSVCEMSDALKHAPKYHEARTWIEKVAVMRDKQVIAIYFRMLHAGELTTK